MRVGLTVEGTVQGVGFRPFVRRAALARGLTGFVRNGRSAVRIEIQGDASSIEDFTRALGTDAPPAAVVRALGYEPLVDVGGETSFDIAPSSARATEQGIAPVLPADLAMCSECASEVLRAGDRRHRYPFTNCTACGPRYTIVTALPYDRPWTSMRTFAMCADCAREYLDIDDRRYHAQPIACPRCGPSLAWSDAAGHILARGEDALERAIRLVRTGGILALRGLGGFQLVCDATSPYAIAALRRRKARPEKPLAVMFRDITQLVASTELSSEELRVLYSREAPIVIVTRRQDAPVAHLVAPDASTLGAMIPSTPLHLLLLEGTAAPIVCTSGNLSEEPICTDLEEARERLATIADGFLSHDRPIVRPVDDSVVRVTTRRTTVLRRARGFAPSAVATVDRRARVLALGAHLKNTVTIACRGQLVPSQHVGDLESPLSRQRLFQTIDDLVTFFDARPRLLACDLHPDYASSLAAERLSAMWDVPLLRVQHHHAHIAACIAEHGETGDVLGLAWDGTGAGTDGTVWGGEALACRGDRFTRRAHLRPFLLPGGEAGVRDPRRVGLGLLHSFLPAGVEAWARRWFGDGAPAYLRALELRINARPCSSVGRLFDGVAALLGLEERTSFEGQAAIRLEELARTAPGDGAYPLPLRGGVDAAFVGDVAPLIHAIIADLAHGVDRARMARRFHEALIDLGVAIAERSGLGCVALGGGAFQNQLLVHGLEDRLERAGFQVLVPSRLPPNDGAISVGQAWLGSMDPRAWA